MIEKEVYEICELDNGESNQILFITTAHLGNFLGTIIWNLPKNT
jgi:hypothetical protein